MRILFFILFAVPVFSQSIDTTQVFTLEKYLTWVKAYHPVMQQAGLLRNKADASLLEARGVLDPKWFGEYEDKSFDEKNYFRVGEAGLKVPLWFGADIKASYLWSNGIFLNPANNLPTNGQAVLGIEIPVLRGLAFDQRRAVVKEARLFKDANEATRRVIVNELLLKAIETYWNWSYHHQVVKIYQNSVELGKERFRLIKESFLQGDKPAIDTLESLIQIQNWSLQLADAQVALQNAQLELSNFLWFENLVPLEISDNLTPENLASTWNPLSAKLNDEVFKNISNSHPELLAIQVKQQQLDIKERLKREQFKPDLRVNYNLLGNGFNLNRTDPEGSVIQNVITENYKWGVTFNYPLLLRKERGGLELVRLEQLDNRYKLQEKELKISNKIRAIYQKLETAFRQLQIYDNMVSNYQRLMDTENEKFRIGESSIFLINSRMQKLIEAQLKMNKLEAEFQKLRWELEWAKGALQ